MILTGDNNTDIAEVLKEIVSRPGLIHESVNKDVCLVKTFEIFIGAVACMLGQLG
jgi:hypothetical protein